VQQAGPQVGVVFGFLWENRNRSLKKESARNHGRNHGKQKSEISLSEIMASSSPTVAHGIIGQPMFQGVSTCCRHGHWVRTSKNRASASDSLVTATLRAPATCSTQHTCHENDETSVWTAARLLQVLPSTTKHCQ
jgi:hypothetical protein